MKQKRTIKAAGRLASLILLITGLWLLAVSCDKDDPVDPDNGNGNGESPEVKYNLYMGDQGGDKVFVIDPDSNVVVDILTGFTDVIYALTPTPGGTRLFVSTRVGPVNWPGKLYAVNMQTKQVELIYDGVGDVYRGINNQFYIITHEPHREVRQIGTIDTLTYEIAIFDTLDMDDAGASQQGVVFHPGLPIMYAPQYGTRRLFAYAYEQKEVIRVYDLYLPRRMTISPDGRYLYLNAGPVYDLVEERVVGSIGGYSSWYMALSPNGDYLYLTDPGGYGIPPTPSGKVFIYDTSLFQYIDEIDVKPFIYGLGSYLTEMIVVTPDGKKAFVSNWSRHLFVLDLENRVVADTLAFRNDAIHVSRLAMGVRP